MEIREDDVFEVLLLTYRLSNALNMHEESAILGSILNASEVLGDVVKVWEKVGPPSQRDAIIAGLRRELTLHRQTINALPELFETGIFSAVFKNVMTRATEYLNMLQGNVHAFPTPGQRAEVNRTAS